ncbi:helix-hairpin-helix domain-containing protein [Halorussus sp. MSC15.2]|uniref:helix-hairpin-helix domain-containing protein n=1 Tax=Halorussus sp. MSC15.2 TaxID=2283638 RepID=UPI0013D3744D|nr:helix-hairpin-helix domain-containing protein [Halorussus sp. MSC15.2]NEU57521.1 DNA polymerase/3'-5' exonuclease PolX [Halorussus sp. MSC15.2]
MTRNAEIADLLEEYADLLSAQGVDYKPKVYERAAESIRDSPEAIEELAAEGPEAVQRIQDVGESISKKVVEAVETGTFEQLEDEREQMPVEMAELTSVEGVGPKTVGDLYRALDVRDLDDLEHAAREGQIREVSGFGEKTEQNILDGIQFARESQGRSLLGDARPVGEAALEFFEAIPEAGRCELAGSLRRWKPTIGDIDVLVGSDDRQAVIDAFTEWEEADEVIEAGTDKASVRSDGQRVDLRVVVPEEFGSAIQYFTGSKEHNIRLRNYAIDRGYKINEYGAFDVSELGSDGSSDSSDDVSEVEDPDSGQRVGERVAGETEAGMYEAVGLPYIEPEMREDRGEIAAAADGDLPDLVEEGEIRGDLHLHTEWSDGGFSVAEMAEAAAEFGHDYISVADHATGPGMVGGVGLDDEELREQLAEIRAMADDLPITVFAGVEANIDRDGDISVGDDLLADLDCVVASPHSALEGDATDRIVAAIEHPSVDIVGHPTGRMIHQRPGVELDIDVVARAAADHGTALEVNSSPYRLDLWGSAVKQAVEEGATIAIDTDAHSPAEYEHVRYGVHTARRGWAQADDILNARDADGVREFLD